MVCAHHDRSRLACGASCLSRGRHERLRGRALHDDDAAPGGRLLRGPRCPRPGASSLPDGLNEVADHGQSPTANYLLYIMLTGPHPVSLALDHHNMIYTYMAETANSAVPRGCLAAAHRQRQAQQLGQRPSHQRRGSSGACGRTKSR